MKRATFQGMACPLANALERIGDGWSLLILRDALYGLRRFDEFMDSLGIASNTLSCRLNALIAHGLLERRPYQDHPPRHEYHLTEAGRDLRHVVIILMAWGNRHSKVAQTIFLADQSTGQPVDLALIDANTGQRITRERHRVRLTADAGGLAHWRLRAGQAYLDNDAALTNPLN